MEFLALWHESIVNHIDKAVIMMGGAFKNKLIIRTGIGSQRPLNPQCQHIGDFTEAIRLMCSNIEVIRLKSSMIFFLHTKKRFIARIKKQPFVLNTVISIMKNRTV